MLPIGPPSLRLERLRPLSPTQGDPWYFKYIPVSFCCQGLFGQQPGNSRFELLNTRKISQRHLMGYTEVRRTQGIDAYITGILCILR